MKKAFDNNSFVRKHLKGQKLSIRTDLTEPSLLKDDISDRYYTGSIKITNRMSFTIISHRKKK